METVDKDKVWKDTLEVLRVSVSDATFGTWLTHTHLSDVKETGGRVVCEIGCNSIFVKSQVEQRYFGLIQDTLTKQFEKPTDLTFIVKPRHEEKQVTTNTPSPLFDQPKINQEEINLATRRSNVRPSFTFEKFAVSGSNQLAHAAAEAIAQSPGNAYNPLFIWGGVGVGKSHLMHAVGNSMISKDTSSKIIACTAEDFTNDIVDGIRNKTTAEVRKKYRKLDALFIDDIQFIAGKDTAQEEFFHTFNAVTSAGGQVILTSDRPPSEISKLEERLKSRFEAGLIVDIAPPDFELRCAIVQIKAEERGIKIDSEIVQLIAGNIDSARAIQGFIVNLFTQVNFKKLELTYDAVQSILGKGNEKNERVIKSNPEDVINIVSKYYSVGKKQLLGESRARPIARPRQMLMYLLKTQLGIPYQEVGRLIGGRDHTTVMHAVNKIQELASSSVDIQEDIRGIKKSL
ncbi:chromosomal replication initiator protein DnaA [Candidatus Woesebacteria bacterium RIFOXYC1_FULL_31_51]|uniref:Chromosomal replication initiator protein DnaA n=1 Tax=Candidatus Woesebacteria bacterium GW2011_GWC2_31_9 TaxID=1618586 RepID=A0A0G0BLS0_9BACT|nr:MAG: chromosomal replication initiator protein DnaA, chromosomal replication initiator protein [Candidatus Woesebacteria bacterium GW2011_GWF1_31_35]KKP23217.1 MAG: Chromosomal replication initiator protein DnaA [Candidatus Woesebacteria bacterium GW2011_GWC1_30_29]KKP25532.1 MAG: Chromosomal replication initiator protein DnaA [Candidatus Woesebacteria bacterium GW2011_GWD1_31_12]KKP27479.1 MAG: Chromosomal replication initiator protein DnaA [Candidatus Woesebacteria bacterium GW2011_GWB1_31_